MNAHNYLNQINMKKHIIYVFTGTGNSLVVAKGISKELKDCSIVSMGNDTHYNLESGYETIGFVFPTYYRGEPRKVREFIKRLNLQNNKDAYYYVVTTMGRYDGNTLCHISKLLKKKGIVLNYAKALDMFSNYVISYDMRDTAIEEAKKSEIDFAPILMDIKNRENNTITSIEILQEIAYRALIKFVPEMDKYYSVSDECIKCGICEKVCPVSNINLDQDGHPVFLHHCEQCVACIQFCPKKAINYKDRTQNRKRYIHPMIKYIDLAKLNGKAYSSILNSMSETISYNRKRKNWSIGANLFAKAIWKIYGM
jgi:ferredoxin